MWFLWDVTVIKDLITFMKSWYSSWICSERIDKLWNKRLWEKKKKKKFSSDSSTEQDFCCRLMYSDINGRQRHHGALSWPQFTRLHHHRSGLGEQSLSQHMHTVEVIYITPHAVTSHVELARPPPSRPASDPCWPGGSTADVAELQRVEELSRLYCGFHCAADTSTEEVLFLCQQESPNIFRDKPNSQSKKLFSCRSLWNGAFPSSSLPSELHRVFSHVEKDSNT